MVNLPLQPHLIVQSRNIAKIFWNLQKPGVTFQCHAPFSSVSCRKQRNASLTRNHIIHERIQHLSSHPIPNEHSYHVGHRCTRCQAFRKLSTRTGRHNQADNTQSSNTYDASEVEKFSKLSEDWWNEQGEFGALHSMNSLRVPLVRDAVVESVGGGAGTLTQPLVGLKVVDVGCGGGILSEPLARLGAEVLGVDASPENVAAAEAHMACDPALTGRITYHCGLVEEVAADQGATYDGVVASEILEHVADAGAFVKACCDLLKPGGSVVFTTMNRTRLAYALGVVAAESILRIVPAGAHDWNKFVTPEELTAMLKENAAQVRLIHGMQLNPISLKWCWSQDTSINYALHAVKEQ